MAIIQQWECVVTETSKDELWATLYDLTNRENAEESACFPLINLPSDMHSLLTPGAVFYWSIETDAGKAISKFSFT